jgi:hypothetical protein
VFQSSPGYKSPLYASTVQQELSLLRKLIALRRTASSKAFIAARAARNKLPALLISRSPADRTR